MKEIKMFCKGVQCMRGAKPQWITIKVVSNEHCGVTWCSHNDGCYFYEEDVFPHFFDVEQSSLMAWKYFVEAIT